jgi:hypothetical protein
MPKSTPESIGPKDSTSDDPFALERAFPSVEQLFESHGEISTANTTVLVAIDTNALLLPYSFKAGNLGALKDVYKKLAGQARLLLPDRVVREFTRLRDQKLSEIIQALQDRRSEGYSGDMPPILESTKSFSAVTASRAELDEAKQAYGKSDRKDILRSLSGNQHRNAAIR